MRIECHGRNKYHSAVFARLCPIPNPRLHCIRSPCVHVEMDNPVKPLREQTIREGAHIAKKEATISHPSRGWLGGGSPGGSEVASKVAKKWILLAFEWLSPMRQKGSKCDASHRNSVRYIANSAVKQTGVEGGGSENAKSGSKGWLRVDRDPSNQGVTLDFSRKYPAILWFVLARGAFGRGPNGIRASRETNESALSANHFEQMVVAWGGFSKMRSVETRVASWRRPWNGGVF